MNRAPMTPLVKVSRDLAAAVDALSFAAPVRHVYNPLRYAQGPHGAYLERYGAAPKDVLFVGMNPGPFGMMQTGVPFGEVAMVRDFLGITGSVTPPSSQHPRRPIEGFACRRSEVSGARFWGWVAARWGTAPAFFRRHFVANYCPLVFLEEGGRNLTPDKLPAQERARLEAACDEALRRTVEVLEPRWLVAIGRFAELRAAAALAVARPSPRPTVVCMLHPSPANPAANRGWDRAADAVMESLSAKMGPRASAGRRSNGPSA